MTNSKTRRNLKLSGLPTTDDERFEQAERLRAGVRAPGSGSYIDRLLDEARADDQRERERAHAAQIERQYQHIMDNGGKALRAKQIAKQQRDLWMDDGGTAQYSRPLSTKADRPYFAYGMNTNVKEMRMRCPDAKPVGAYVLDGYKLVFRGVADIVKEKGHKVAGVIWLISEKCEAALDRLEGYPRLYVKGDFTTEVKGKRAKVMFYRMVGTRRIAPPSQHYLTCILAGYRSFKVNTAGVVKAAQAAYDANPPMQPFKDVPADDDTAGGEEFF